MREQPGEAKRQTAQHQHDRISQAQPVRQHHQRQDDKDEKDVLNKDALHTMKITKKPVKGLGEDGLPWLQPEKYNLKNGEVVLGGIKSLLHVLTRKSTH